MLESASRGGGGGVTGRGGVPGVGGVVCLVRGGGGGVPGLGGGGVPGLRGVCLSALWDTTTPPL